MTAFLPAASAWLARVSFGLTMALGIAAGAYAQSQIDLNAGLVPSETRTRLISIADLNLGAPAGRQKLETRLQVAAGEVCGKRSPWSVRVPADYVRCYDAALASGTVLVAAN